MEWGMEESGEQCTVVFAIIVTEPASEFVHVGSVQFMQRRQCIVLQIPPGWSGVMRWYFYFEGR